MDSLSNIKNQQPIIKDQSTALPKRLKIAIRDQQERSEVLIGVPLPNNLPLSTC